MSDHRAKYVGIRKQWYENGRIKSEKTYDIGILVEEKKY